MDPTRIQLRVIVREFVDIFLPYITSMVNVFLIQGRLPDSQKHAIVPPFFKKLGLDMADMANFLSVSSLTSMSKVIERTAAKQLNEFLATEDLLPHNQSDYRKRDSTETTMFHVLSDALAAADRQQVTLIGMLYLSISVRLRRSSAAATGIRHECRLSGTVLQWIRRLYLAGRSKLHTTGTCSRFSHYSTTFHEGRSSALYCSYCTQPSFIELRQVML